MPLADRPQPALGKLLARDTDAAAGYQHMVIRTDKRSPLANTDRLLAEFLRKTGGHALPRRETHRSCTPCA